MKRSEDLPRLIALSRPLPFVLKGTIQSSASTNLIAVSPVPIKISPPDAAILPTVEPSFSKSIRPPSLPSLRIINGVPSRLN